MGKIEILENIYQELDSFLILNSFCDKIGGDIKCGILLYCPVKSQVWVVQILYIPRTGFWLVHGA